MTDLLYIGIMFVISQPDKHVDLKNDEQTFEGILGTETFEKSPNLVKLGHIL